MNVIATGNVGATGELAFDTITQGPYTFTDGSRVEVTSCRIRTPGGVVEVPDGAAIYGIARPHISTDADVSSVGANFANAVLFPNDIPRGISYVDYISQTLGKSVKVGSANVIRNGVPFYVPIPSGKYDIHTLLDLIENRVNKEFVTLNLPDLSLSMDVVQETDKETGFPILTIKMSIITLGVLGSFIAALTSDILPTSGDNVLPLYVNVAKPAGYGGVLMDQPSAAYISQPVQDTGLSQDSSFLSSAKIPWFAPAVNVKAANYNVVSRANVDFGMGDVFAGVGTLVDIDNAADYVMEDYFWDNETIGDFLQWMAENVNISFTAFSRTGNAALPGLYTPVEGSNIDRNVADISSPDTIVIRDMIQYTRIPNFPIHQHHVYPFSVTAHNSTSLLALQETLYVTDGQSRPVFNEDYGLITGDWRNNNPPAEPPYMTGGYSNWLSTHYFCQPTVTSDTAVPGHGSIMGGLTSGSVEGGSGTHQTYRTAWAGCVDAVHAVDLCNGTSLVMYVSQLWPETAPAVGAAITLSYQVDVVIASVTADGEQFGNARKSRWSELMFSGIATLPGQTFVRTPADLPTADGPNFLTELKIGFVSVGINLSNELLPTNLDTESGLFFRPFIAGRSIAQSSDDLNSVKFAEATFDGFYPSTFFQGLETNKATTKPIVGAFVTSFAETLPEAYEITSPPTYTFQAGGIKTMDFPLPLRSHIETGEEISPLYPANFTQDYIWNKAFFTSEELPATAGGTMDVDVAFIQYSFLTLPYAYLLQTNINNETSFATGINEDFHGALTHKKRDDVTCFSTPDAAYFAGTDRRSKDAFYLADEDQLVETFSSYDTNFEGYKVTGLTAAQKTDTHVLHMGYCANVLKATEFDSSNEGVHPVYFTSVYDNANVADTNSRMSTICSAFDISHMITSNVENILTGSTTPVAGDVCELEFRVPTPRLISAEIFKTHLKKELFIAPLMATVYHYDDAGNTVKAVLGNVLFEPIGKHLSAWRKPSRAQLDQMSDIVTTALAGNTASRDTQDWVMVDHVIYEHGATVLDLVNEDITYSLLFLLGHDFMNFDHASEIGDMTSFVQVRFAMKFDAVALDALTIAGTDKILLEVTCPTLNNYAGEELNATYVPEISTSFPAPRKETHINILATEAGTILAQYETTLVRADARYGAGNHLTRIIATDGTEDHRPGDHIQGVYLTNDDGADVTRFRKYTIYRSHIADLTREVTSFYRLHAFFGRKIFYSPFVPMQYLSNWMLLESRNVAHTDHLGTVVYATIGASNVGARLTEMMKQTFAGPVVTQRQVFLEGPVANSHSPDIFKAVFNGDQQRLDQFGTIYPQVILSSSAMFYLTRTFNLIGYKDLLNSDEYPSAIFPVGTEDLTYAFIGATKALSKNVDNRTLTGTFQIVTNALAMPLFITSDLPIGGTINGRNVRALGEIAALKNPSVSSVDGSPFLEVEWDCEMVSGEKRLVRSASVNGSLRYTITDAEGHPLTNRYIVTNTVKDILQGTPSLAITQNSITLLVTANERDYWEKKVVEQGPFNAYEQYSANPLKRPKLTAPGLK